MPLSFSPQAPSTRFQVRARVCDLITDDFIHQHDDGGALFLGHWPRTPLSTPPHTLHRPCSCAPCACASEWDGLWRRRARSTMFGPRSGVPRTATTTTTRPGSGGPRDRARNCCSENSQPLFFGLISILSEIREFVCDSNSFFFCSFEVRFWTPRWNPGSSVCTDPGGV